MKARIVFVDDEEAILRSIVRLFREFPYEIVTFTNPIEALEKLPELNPDVIISDYRMPMMDGVTLLELAAKALPDTIRILLTGYADVGTAQNAINGAKVFRFLTKPWQGAELLGAVESALYEIERKQAELWLLTAERESNQMLLAMNESLKGKLEEKSDVADLNAQAFRVQVGSTARSLLAALEMRSPGLYATSTRVAHIAVRIAELARLHWLHDMAVLSGLLLDVGYLAMPEMPQRGGSQLPLHVHCNLGTRLLECGNFPPLVIEAVRSHHENWDGTGPFALAGVQIPQLARVLRVSDTIAGLLAPYKATELLPDEALIACIDGANARQLDPSLSALVIGEIKARGARSLFPARPPKIPELESLSLPIIA